MHLLSSKCAESIDLLKKSIAKSLPYIKQTEQNLNQCPVEVILGRAPHLPWGSTEVLSETFDFNFTFKIFFQLFLKLLF